MTEPKKLPPLMASEHEDGLSHAKYFMVDSASMVGMTKEEALEAIRRCEMHDRLVEALEVLTQYAQKQCPNPLAKPIQSARAILKENQ